VRAVLAQRHGFDSETKNQLRSGDTVEDSAELEKFSIALQILLGFIGALTLGVGRKSGL